MNTELKEQLDELASNAAHGLKIEHPAFANARSPFSPRNQLSFALATTALIAMLLTGVWWLQRQAPSELDTIRPIGTLPIPSLLLEETTPLSELPLGLRQHFEGDIQVPLLFAMLEPSRPALRFEAVHTVELESSPYVVAIGLDTTGTFLCTATLTEDDRSDSHCKPFVPTSPWLLSAESWIGSNGEERMIAFVQDGVTSLTFQGQEGSATVDVVRNIAVFENLGSDVIANFDDGTSQNLTKSEQAGELTSGDLETTRVTMSGCLRVDGYFFAEAVFSHEVTGDAVASVMVTPSQLLVSKFNEPTPELINSEQFEISGNIGSTSVQAAWDNETSGGSLILDCGERLIDLSPIREGLEPN